MSWDQAANLLAELNFGIDYPYNFNIKAPNPPLAAPDTKAIALSSFASVNINQSGYNAKITDYINKVLLK